MIKIQDLLGQYELRRSGDKKLIETTGCQPPCKLRHFKIKTPLTRNMYEPMPNEIANKYRIQLEITSTKPTVEEHEEVYIYDGNNLMADFGGFLGMLLGASCLTLFDEAVSLLEWLFKQFKHF